MNSNKYPFSTEEESIFYDIRKDLEKYPDAAILIIVGGRGTGKTYSTLRFVYEEKHRFIFMKRTNADVDLMCERLNNKDKEFTIDISPFKSLNRDFNWNVRAYKMFNGFGGFWNCTPDGEPVGDPVGYILSFNAISKFKGYDLSDCDYIIFDEFIPLPYERVNRHEGIELMDLYRTVGRAGNILTGKILKLICLANATTVSCPVLNDLELADVMVDMGTKNENVRYLEDRGILIHKIEDINGFREQEAKNPIYKAMRGTKWAKMSLDNDFAYNDFSAVGRMSLKGMKCLLLVHRGQRTYYIYVGDAGYYMTYRKSNNFVYYYDLDRENDQKRFYVDECIDLRQECIDGRMRFETYEMYDLIVNYKDFYKV